MGTGLAGAGLARPDAPTANETRLMGKYSKADLFELLEPMGFAIPRHYFYQEDKSYRYRRLKFSLKDVLGEVFPSLRPVNVVLAEKVAEDTHKFDETDALS